MTSESTIVKLNEMRLSTMADTYVKQLGNKFIRICPLMTVLVCLWILSTPSERTRSWRRLISQAHFRYSNACVEDIEYLPDRKLDKPLILRLAECQYIQDHHNVLILRSLWKWEVLSFFSPRNISVQKTL